MSKYYVKNDKEYKIKQLIVFFYNEPGKNFDLFLRIFIHILVLKQYFANISYVHGFEISCFQHTLLKNDILLKVSGFYFIIRRGASDNVSDSMVLSNPANAQNISCLGLRGKDIARKARLYSLYHYINIIARSKYTTDVDL